MSLINTNAANLIGFNTDIYNSKPQIKVDETNIIQIQSNSDYAEFSINYADDEVSSILNNIANTFEINNSMYYQVSENGDMLSIEEYGEKYGQLLKNINNSNFDETTKTQLTTILDNSFDYFTEKKAKEIGGNISAFFNYAYSLKAILTESDGNKIGIKGEKLVNQDDVEKNIKNLFLGAKTFYKNNLDGTKDELNEFLEENFSTTESIEKLSYTDFMLLEKELNDINSSKNREYSSINERYKGISKEMSNSVEDLKKEGASPTLIIAFEKAVYQNDNCNKRKSAYSEINFTYLDKLEKLAKERMRYESQLRELEERRKEMIKEYNKKMEKLKHDAYKLNMLLLSMNQDGSKYDPIENLEKQHEKQILLFDTRKDLIEGRISELKEITEETVKNYKHFSDDPASVINEYLGMDEKGKEKFLNEI